MPNVENINKPIVFYKGNENPYIVVGGRGFVFPINHPSELVSNTSWIQTSPVLSYDRLTGVFETENTIYKPQ